MIEFTTLGILTDKYTHSREMCMYDNYTHACMYDDLVTIVYDRY